MHFATIQRQQLLSSVGVTEMSWIKYWIWFYSSSFLPFLYPRLNKLTLLQNFREYNLWLAAENGMFLRCTTGKWMTTMPEHLNMEWVDSLKVSILL